jgi:hypothetical protein
VHALPGSPGGASHQSLDSIELPAEAEAEGWDHVEAVHLAGLSGRKLGRTESWVNPRARRPHSATSVYAFPSWSTLPHATLASCSNTSSHPSRRARSSSQRLLSSVTSGSTS